MSSGTIKVKEELKGFNALHTLRMTYEDGGKTEVWSTSEKTVRVHGGAKPVEIRAAFEAK